MADLVDISPIRSLLLIQNENRYVNWAFCLVPFKWSNSQSSADSCNLRVVIWRRVETWPKQKVYNSYSGYVMYLGWMILFVKQKKKTILCVGRQRGKERKKGKRTTTKMITKLTDSMLKGLIAKIMKDYQLPQIVLIIMALYNIKWEVKRKNPSGE